ncbi:MAG: phage head-tail connector protein [Clostridia bacterium]|nr:phage head-tail connector protein [Clostridia bacterium]
MIEEIKILLGDAASNYTDALIGLCAKQALAEVESYCNRAADYELEIVAQRIAIIKLNRINTEGLASQSFSGVSESYIDGYPADILTILNRKRKIKVV